MKELVAGLVLSLMAFTVTSSFFSNLEVPVSQAIEVTNPAKTPLVAQVAPEGEGIILLVNEYRKSKGLPPLLKVKPLERATSAKAKNLTVSGRFAHRDETVHGIEYFANKEGYRLNDYRLLGENLACGIADSQEIFDAWVASELHNKNLLEPVFTEYGIGFAQGNVHYGTCNSDGLVVVMAFGGVRE